MPNHLPRLDAYAECSLQARHLLHLSYTYCNDQKTDGAINLTHFRHLAVDCQLTEAEAKAAAEELIAAGFWGPGYRLIDFLDWNYSAAEIETRKRTNREDQQEHRDRLKVSPAPPSKANNTPQHSTADTYDLTKALHKDLRPAGGAVDDSEDTMPLPADIVTLIEVWEEIAGRKATLVEINHTRWMLDTYNRLDADAQGAVIRQVVSRPGQEIPRHLKYFTDAIREANDAIRPQRANGATTALVKPYIVPRGIGEPCETCGKVGCQTCEAPA